MWQTFEQLGKVLSIPLRLAKLTRDSQFIALSKVDIFSLHTTGDINIFALELETREVVLIQEATWNH